MSIIQGIPQSPKEMREIDKKKKTINSNTVGKKNTSGPVSSDAKSGISKDSVQISSIARSLLKNTENIEFYKNELKNIKTIDKSELKEIHNKLQANYYNKPEVLDRIVEGIIPVLQSFEAEKIEKPTDKASELDMIRKNIDEGFYNSEEVLDTIVDRMLNPDNLF